MKELECTCREELGMRDDQKLVLHLSWCPEGYNWKEMKQEYDSAPFWKRIFMKNPIKFTKECRAVPTHITH